MIIKLHFLFIFFLSFISIIASSSPPFNFTVYGTADVNHTSIILTQNLHNCTPNAHHSNIGRVFYKNPIRFLDSTFNSTVSFSTRFSFIIIPPPPPCLAGEGIAFLITTDSNSLPHSVGCIGLPKSLDQFSSDSSFLAVEFDTSFDQGLGDINDNHVGIDVDSIFSVASVDLKSIGIDLKSGKRITAWIEYRNSAKIIQIWVGYTRVKPESPILVAPLDISKRFNGFMYVGFSGSNGRGSATHLIDNWKFKTSESVPPNIEVETVASENCLICFPEDSGQDEEHKTGSSNHRHSDKRVLELALGLLGLIVILILLTVCLVVLYVCFMKRRNPSEEEPQICSRFQENRMPRRLKLSEIRSATKGFCRNQIVSEGVSAIVYEASLPWCGNVAVKRFIHANKTGSFNGQFVTEFVKMVGSLRHKNLVQLHGWCCEKKELILVYEFITNGSLNKILHHRAPANNSLSFDWRSKILLGVSSALVYLHEECEKQIIHRNVKTSNIMLDADFAPKLGDSGIGELYDHNSRARDGTLQAGAIGYLAPEYVFSGVPTVKTDVYSFGVVVLEVASGRPAVDEGGMLVTDWVWDLWERKTLVAGADPTLIGRFNGIDMEMMLMVGLICVHPNYQMRPIMKEVVQMLQGGLVPNLPAAKPTVMIQSVVVERSPEVVVGCGGDDGVTQWGTPKSHFSKM